jgi:hypothetical protein
MQIDHGLCILYIQRQISNHNSSITRHATKAECAPTCPNHKQWIQRLLLHHFFVL